MKNIGIIGGTFNPIHNGHIAIAQAAYQKLGLDCILFMPNGYPAYKEPPGISDQDRENMVKLAIKDIPGFVYSDFEISKGDITYTADTLTELSELHPGWRIFYIVGSDSLCYMDKWVKPDVIFKSAVIVAAYRETESFDEIKDYSEFLKKKYNAEIRLLFNESVPVSSTDIRKKAASGKSIDDSVPPNVAEYISSRGLYNGI